MNKTEIINRLKSGNQQFVNDKLESKNQGSKRRKTVIEGQDPFAIVLSCADSRIVPELIFDTGIGELFVLRVAGNVANTSTIASIEYAAAYLGTPIIIVLSHQNCGAVTAAVKGGNNGYNINHLLAHITPAICEAAENATVDDVAKINAKLTVQDLNNRSAIIADAVNSGKLEILPAYYYLDTGVVEFLD